MDQLLAGVAAVDFTPRLGLPLMGNFRDDYAARGCHDPLQAKALVLADGQTTLALLALNLCMIERDQVAQMRRAIAARSGIPPENILIHATHTHAGPATSGRFSLGLDWAAFRGEVEGMLAKAAVAVDRAHEALAPARLAVGTSTEYRIAFNRRLRRADGSVQMNWESLQPGFAPQAIVGSGPVDPRVACLVVERGDRPAAALVHFALHPAILAGDNWHYSADYPGYLAEALRKTVAPELDVLFFNGCCGDVNHIDYRDPLQGRGDKMAQRVGYLLAAAAHEAMARRQPIAAGPLRTASTRVPLKRLAVSEEERARGEQVLAEAGGRAGQVDGLPEAHFARVRRAMYDRQHEPDPVEVMALRIGPLALVGLPGEVFCELGLDLQRRSPAGWTLPVGLANDAIGYLPTRAAFAQGGYESLPGSTFYQPGAGEQLVDAAVKELRALFRDA